MIFEISTPAILYSTKNLPRVVSSDFSRLMPDEKPPQGGTQNA